MTKGIKLEFLLLFLFIAAFIFLRSLYFKESLDFSTDQATFSSAALDIWQKKEIVLIGPRFTLEYHGRYLFFGPAIYYMQLIFLLLGGFDPIISSYIFVLFASLTLVPLYFGIKMLIGKQAAIMMLIVYSFLPYFVNFTKFLWNPTFQLSLLPFLVLTIGMFKKNKDLKTFFGLSVLAGIILQFHYTFLIIVLGLLIYYLIFYRLNFKYVIIFFSGLILANSWLIIFELRHNFYFLNTIIIFLNHFKEITQTSISHNGRAAHYYLGMFFFSIIVILFLARNFLYPKLLFLAGASLFFYSLSIYMVKPTHAYGMQDNWSYLEELKVNQIIESQRKVNFNLANLIYDPKAEVQKYLLRKDGVKFNDDYMSNDFLFVLSEEKAYLHDPAYEVSKLQPAEQLNVWKINSKYNLYLARRLPKR